MPCHYCGADAPAFAAVSYPSPPSPLPHTRRVRRLSTVQSADQIVVMQSGRIAEKGTHNELLKRDGAYSELMSSQEMILGASV